MGDTTAIGVALGKSVSELHGVTADGTVAPCRRPRQGRVLAFLGRPPSCLVGMKARAGARFRAREPARPGPEARLMPPSCVKPCVGRGETDAVGAGAIAEAVTCPGLRFVPVRTGERRAVPMTHRTRDFPVRRLTRITTAIRACLAGFGIAAPKGVHNVERPPTMAHEAVVPEGGLGSVNLLTEQVRDTRMRIGDVTVGIRKAA